MAPGGVREQSGPTMDFEDSFGSVVDVSAIDRWCTPFSYANVNTDDPEAVARFYALVTGDDTGEGTIKAKMDKLRKDKKTLDHSGFTLGFEAFPASYPLVGVETQINPNHAERIVLEAILATPAYALDDPSSVCDELCAAADAGTLDLKKIKSVLGPDPDPRLSAWFGTRTWFWRVSMAVQGYEYIAVLRRTGPMTEGDVLVLAGFIKEGDCDE
jgi:hypothetical protein